MKFLYYNCQRLGNFLIILYFKDIRKLYIFDIMFFIEIKYVDSYVYNLVKELG